jgi:hypothetical protein
MTNPYLGDIAVRERRFDVGLLYLRVAEKSRPRMAATDPPSRPPTRPPHLHRATMETSRLRVPDSIISETSS